MPLITSGRAGYESGWCAFFISETPGGTVSGTVWVGIESPRAVQPTPEMSKGATGARPPLPPASGRTRAAMSCMSPRPTSGSGLAGVLVVEASNVILAVRTSPLLSARSRRVPDRRCVGTVLQLHRRPFRHLHTKELGVVGGPARGRDLPPESISDSLPMPGCGFCDLLLHRIEADSEHHESCLR
jgi:hypothetical protein